MRAQNEKSSTLVLTFRLAQNLVVKLFFLIFQESVFLLQVCNSLKREKKCFPCEAEQRKGSSSGFEFQLVMLK